jgi:hypothetical protein
MQELESYHLSAAMAHREHSRIALNMPEIPQPVLAASGAKGWIVAPDPDPLDIRDQGNGTGAAERLGPPSAAGQGGEPGANGQGSEPGANGSDPARGDDETGGRS